MNDELWTSRPMLFPNNSTYMNPRVRIVVTMPTEPRRHGRARECVMLNNGPYILDAVRVLDDIMQRMEKPPK